MAEKQHRIVGFVALDKFVSEDRCPIILKDNSGKKIGNIESEKDFTKRTEFFKKIANMYVIIYATPNLSYVES
jgi:hypothetical protein